ncbi:aspartyl/asparaginyl beta-hydroxylase domain-containing protein [Pacificimonas sp. WHA3]|uniref:Aspartyl/asparaginyl beta-hydroxylase domain-containing protein n=1 Tax=Pacificimonas pallii TaxID=2827236 RepID=A0ABS6SCQ7_9SPHN|nr:aspartyl/asparaginyl beta-hydroxylase domain-containing protein [Pacificimonas pallii]MBV7256207.1 aspartyl/asparaginyl beta-hydroxylase domain-containing protein [Pacificimonas pallii]
MPLDEEAAVDQLIANDPGNVAALIKKGDLRTSAGDEKIANSFYRKALKVASGGPVSSELKSELLRVQAACRRSSGRFEEYLADSLRQAGFGDGQRPPRFQESIEILLGQRPAVSSLQNPRTYFYPGLPQRRYYERHEFPWAAELEQKADIIRDELLPSVKDERLFRPYLYSDPSRPPKHGMVDNPDWSSLTLWETGVPVPETISQFPKTIEVVQKADLLRMPKRAPQIMFSKLAAGARIEPHVGLLNCRLVCHLPLIVPDGCMFRVGGEDRQWREGQLLVFDDSIVHEASNNSHQDRIVLIFEIWRPELDADERAAVTALFHAVDTY